MRILILLFLVLASFEVVAQQSTGAQFLTQDEFLYGRFEVRMQSAPGDGIVSSFFLYHIDEDCNWPESNNEIDIEMTGNVEDLYFTTHYPGPWYYGEQVEVDFNPHEEMHDYAIEWEPGVVRWYVDGEFIHMQDESFVSNLIHPLRLMMNLWVANAVSWVGEFDPAVMPSSSRYDWVKVYEYTPGTGDYGNNNNFTFLWEDNFDSFDEDRWEITDFGGFDGNLSGFYATNTQFNTEEGEVVLTVQEAGPELAPVQVTFSLDVSNLEYDPWDVFYLAGSFNDWCGNCYGMTDSDGDDVYTYTVSLTPGKYEYLFNKNFWQETGSAPLGSACDFEPCDEWQNYGFILPAGSEDLVLDPVCWGECGPCAVSAIDEVAQDIDLSWDGAYLTVVNNGAHGALEVMNTLGQVIFRSEVESGQHRFAPNVHGLFISRFSRGQQQTRIDRWLKD